MTDKQTDRPHPENCHHGWPRADCKICAHPETEQATAALVEADEWKMKYRFHPHTLVELYKLYRTLGNFKNGVEHQGTDEGEVYASGVFDRVEARLRGETPLPSEGEVAWRRKLDEPDERPLPTYGQISWQQLGRDVHDAMTARRADHEFDPSYYPGHQMVPQINFNSLARIVDKYRWYGLPVVYASPPSASSVREATIEECAKIAESFLYSAEAKAYTNGARTSGNDEACTKIAEAIRALSGEKQEGELTTVRAGDAAERCETVEQGAKSTQTIG